MTVAFTVDGLRRAGFSGFVPVRPTYFDRCATVAVGPAVYVVIRTATSGPLILKESPAGRFKGKDPTIAPALLRAKWVAKAPVLYIGKADELRRRLRQLLDFAYGKPVGHWGGRYLWQVAGSDDWLIAWRSEANPRATEAALLQAFVAEFGSLPYANLVG
jgi:hypothetical protein